MYAGPQRGDLTLVEATVVLAVYFVMASAIGAVVLLYNHGRLQKGKIRQVADVPSAPVEPSQPEETLIPVPLGIKELSDPELDLLRLQVWRSRRRRVKLMGRLFLGGGLVALVVGYFSGYFGVELLAAFLIPTGAFFAFSGNEPYIKSSMAGGAVISAMFVLREALDTNADRGHAVFVPGADKNQDVKMFIPSEDLPDGVSAGQSPSGHSYTPLGHELFRSYLREVGGTPEQSIPALLDQLRTVMTALDLVDEIMFDVQSSEIDVRIRNVTFAEIGRFSELNNLFARVGCPVTNSIAEWVAYGTNSRVSWLDAKIDPISRSALVRLSVIPESKK